MPGEPLEWSCFGFGSMSPPKRTDSGNLGLAYKFGAFVPKPALTVRSLVFLPQIKAQLLAALKIYNLV